MVPTSRALLGQVLTFQANIRLGLICMLIAEGTYRGREADGAVATLSSNTDLGIMLKNIFLL